MPSTLNRRRGYSWTGALVLLACVTSTYAGVALASGEVPGAVGDPPTNNAFRPQRALIIGTADAYGTGFELIAYESRNYGLCADLDQLDSGGGGGCGFGLAKNEAIAAQSWGFNGYPGTARTSSVGGPLSTRVASVVAKVRRGDTMEKTPVIVTQVDEELASRLGHKGAFGFFTSITSGCVQAKRFRAVAKDANGDVLGRTSGLDYGIGDDCRS